MSSPCEALIKNPSAITKEDITWNKKCLKQHYSTVRSMKKVAVLMEDGAFALFFRYHLRGFDRLKSPHPPGICHPRQKKCQCPGVLGTAGIDWCIISLIQSFKY